MLIESNEDKDFGSIIFSENKFDFVTNFTKINKREPDVREFIDFKEVSKFIGQPVEKSLILYRLLTNDSNLDPFSSKLGYFIKVLDKIEVVYFDPIFIIKDIMNLNILVPREEFRFKIQQVGYRTKSVTDDSCIFEERFSIDMSEVESENQNDSIFAETMLSVKGTLGRKRSSNNFKLKYDSFQNVASESSKPDKQFYHLDGNNNQRNTTYVESSTTKELGNDENDFFSRMKLKKEKKEYKSNTLKMFK